MGDIPVWIPDVHPNDVNEVIQPENAIHVIRDLVLKVKKRRYLCENSHF